MVPPTPRPARTRVELVVGLLDEALGGTVQGRQVLDCGGGSGTYAVPLAARGATVTVVDISADALATLRRRVAERNLLPDSVVDVAGDVESLPDLFADASFDLVLAHGVLDAVGDASAAFAAMARLVRPGGLLSVLVANPVAAVLARALAGDAPAALALLERTTETSCVDHPGLTPLGHAPTPDDVETMAGVVGLEVEGRYGVGVFSDLVPGAAGETAAGREALAVLDGVAADLPPFCDIASRVHLVLRRPG